MLLVTSIGTGHIAVEIDDDSLAIRVADEPSSKNYSIISSNLYFSSTEANLFGVSEQCRVVSGFFEP